MGTLYAYFDNTFAYKFSLRQDVITALPAWRDNKEFPPLSPRAAIAGARTAVRKILAPELGDFEPNLSSCALAIASKFEGTWWYYRVDWFVPSQDVGADWAQFSVPVLFDGSTPEPEKFPYEERFDMYQQR